MTTSIRPTARFVNPGRHLPLIAGSAAVVAAGVPPALPRGPWERAAPANPPAG